MPLDRKVVSYTLLAGVDESTDPASLQPGALLAAENVRFTRNGAAEKRPGHTLVANNKLDIIGGTGVQSPNSGEGRLAAQGNELLWLDGQTLNAWSDVNNSFNIKCLLPRFSATSATVAAPGLNVTSYGSTVVQGPLLTKLRMVAYSTQYQPNALGGNVYAKAFDLTSGAFHPTGLAGDLVASGRYTQVYVIQVNNNPIVVYTDVTGANVYMCAYNGTSNAWGSPVTIVTDNIADQLGNANPVYAASITGDTSYFWVAYSRTSDRKLVVKQFLATNGTLNATCVCSDAGYGTYGVGAGPANLTLRSFGGCAETGGYVYVSYTQDSNDANGLKLRLTRLVTGSWVEDNASGFPMTVRNGGVSGQEKEAGLTAVGSCSGVARGPNSTTVQVAYTTTYGPFFSSPQASVCNTWTALVTGTTVSNGKAAVSSRLISAPFYNSGRYYAVCQRDTGTTWTDQNDPVASGFGEWNGYNQGSVGVLDLRHDSPAPPVDVCVLYPAQVPIEDMQITGSGSSATANYARKFTTQTVDSNMAFVLPTIASPTAHNVNAVTLSTSDQTRLGIATVGSQLFVGGGLVSAYDGVSLYPTCFVTEPAWCRIGQSSGTLTTSNTWNTANKYYVQTAWRRTDAMGRVSYGGADYGSRKGGSPGYYPTRGSVLDQSYFTPNTTTTQAQVYYNVPSDGWDGYASSLSGSGRSSVDVYWSVNDTSTSRRLTAQAFTPAQPPVNGASSNYVYYLTDVPYTDPAAPGPYTPAQLPNVQPPCFLAVCSWKGRMVGIDHTKRRVWFSKQIAEGIIPQFVLDFTQEIPFDGVALEHMDGNLVVFGERNIALIDGDGPGPNGNGGSWTQATVLATNLGCTEPRSVVRTPDGIMYQNGVGIYLMDRGNSVKFIGQEVRDTLSQFPVITSAIVHPTQPVVLFTCCNAGLTAGRRLVYDYRLNRWSVDLFKGGSALLSQVVCNGVLYLLSAVGRVYREDPSTWLDDGVWTTMRVKFAATRLGGLHGYQRVWRAALQGTRYSDHALTVNVYTDDSPTAGQSRTYSYTTAALAGPERMDLRIKNQQCRALSLEVIDAAPQAGGTLGTGQGMALSGVGLEIGVLGDIARAPSNRRV